VFGERRRRKKLQLRCRRRRIRSYLFTCFGRRRFLSSITASEVTATQGLGIEAATRAAVE
jgi:hypothetical protein